MRNYKTPRGKHRQNTLQYTGIIQRDDMGWEVGGGFMIGKSCTPMADSCQCMAKQCIVKQNKKYINFFKKVKKNKEKSQTNKQKITAGSSMSPRPRIFEIKAKINQRT